MRLTARAVLTGALLMLALPASAQEQDPDASGASEIVITGTRSREEQVRDFVAALTPAPTGVIPRFVDHVCPVAVGLLPAQNERIAARLRRVATSVNLKVGPSGCAPNAFVIVTRDKRAFVEALAQERPESFGSLSHRQVRRLSRTRGPAVAWQLTGPVDSSGTPLRFDEAAGYYVNDTTDAASRIRSSGGQGFDASVLVVESGALEGLSATQLADYAAMRLFARLDPSRLPAPVPPTILTVLEAPMGTAVPLSMTAWDAGLLRGLYGSATSLRAGAQRSQIAREVKETVDQPRP